jgi:hypothetical protein
MGCWQMAAASRFTSGECSVALNISTCTQQTPHHDDGVGGCAVLQHNCKQPNTAANALESRHARILLRAVTAPLHWSFMSME